MQSVQKVEPGPETLFSEHLIGWLDPEVGQKYPGGHCLHSLDAATSEKVPGIHSNSIQNPSGLKFKVLKPYGFRPISSLDFPYSSANCTPESKLGLRISQSEAGIQIMSHQMRKLCGILPCSPDFHDTLLVPDSFHSHFTSYISSLI